MSLEHLWAGWRSAYVSSVTGETGAAAASGEDACIFCRIIESDEPDESRYLVHATANCVVLLNAFPYASGHLLVLPRRHVDDLAELEPAESAEFWATSLESLAAIRAAYGPDGVNIGMNLGRAAGAGIPSHVHLHLVPRWLGDTNFMTSIAEVRVLPEPLGTAWTKLRAAWPR